MKIFIENSYEGMSKKAASFLIFCLKKYLTKRGKVVFLPSAGKSPTLIYNILKERKNEINWKNVLVIQMDEYVGDFEDKFSFRGYLIKHLIEPLGICNFIPLPKLSCQDLSNKYILHHEKLVDALGGIDLALHGIGINGHIGFNEPGCKLDQISGVFALTDSTISANKNSFINTKIPSNAISLGLNILTKTKENIILASGESKKYAIQRLLTAKSFSSDFPVSALVDKNTTLITEKSCADK